MTQKINTRFVAAMNQMAKRTLISLIPSYRRAKRDVGLEKPFIGSNEWMTFEEVVDAFGGLRSDPSWALRSVTDTMTTI